MKEEVSDDWVKKLSNLVEEIMEESDVFIEEGIEGNGRVNVFIGDVGIDRNSDEEIESMS